MKQSRYVFKNQHIIFFPLFSNWDWSDLLLFDADWLYCLEKNSFFAAAQLTFNRINPETALTCNFGQELHCSILWHGKYANAQQILPSYSHHSNTPEPPKFPAVSQKILRLHAVGLLELMMTAVQSLWKLIHGRS